MQNQQDTTGNIVPAAKQRAKRLRSALAEKDITLNHGQCLDLVARMDGYRDWNVLAAGTSSLPASAPLRQDSTGPGAWYLDRPVTGRVYGRNFSGRIVALKLKAKPGLVHVTIQFDEKTNVSGLELMEDWRHRMMVTLNEDGRSVNSAGRPQGDLYMDL